MIGSGVFLGVATKPAARLTRRKLGVYCAPPYCTLPVEFTPKTPSIATVVTNTALAKAP